MGLFTTIETQSDAWRLKAAFAAGIMTHTVVDRVFHETIDGYATTLGETGTLEKSTHYEIETLIDIYLLRRRGLAPGQYLRRHLMLLDEPSLYRLYSLYIGHMTGDPVAPSPSLVRVLKKAHVQQYLFLRLFAMRRSHQVIRLVNGLTAGRLQPWNTLFYAGAVTPRNFPFLLKLERLSMKDTGQFARMIMDRRSVAIEEAVKTIQTAILECQDGD
jgi:hypothetical protein